MKEGSRVVGCVDIDGTCWPLDLPIVLGSITWLCLRSKFKQPAGTGQGIVGDLPVSLTEVGSSLASWLLT